jgi:hypothetical protein
MPTRGHFILHSRFLPDVTAGRYEYVSRVTGAPFTTREEHTHVEVTAPRFTMPTDQILSSFPPANAEGAFGDRLPQIVLKRRTLPWERNPAGGSGVGTTPWLALVVLAEGEGEVVTATRVRDAVTAGVSLPHPEDADVEQTACLAVTETVLRKVFPTRADLELLAHVREVDVNDTELVGADDDGWLAVVLANRLPVMDVAAGKAVRYMACLVNLEGQLGSLPPEQADDDFFVFERVQDWRVYYDQALSTDQLVTGTGLLQALPSRAPRDAARAAGFAAVPTSTPARAALDGAAVSASSTRSDQWSIAVEGVATAALQPEAQRLVRDAMGRGWHVPITEIALEKVYRFPVLAYWSFTTTEGATFEYLMQNLDYGLLGTLDGEHLPRDPQLPPDPPPTVGQPTPPPRPVTTKVLETGHVQLDHRTRRGDTTRAWFRGPLVPHPMKRDQPVDGVLPLAHSADQLRRTIPDGSDDLGYPAAFEIGRLLALSQLSIVSALLRFRSEQFGQERVRRVVDAFVPFRDLLVGTDASLSRLVSHTLVEALAQEPETTIGPPRPVVDPGRPVRVSGDLDRLVASGLGLDLDSLQKVATRVGMEAAVSGASVPVAAQHGEVTDELTVQLMRAALDARLAEGVAIATSGLGRVVVDHDGRPGAPRAERPPDALDDLIAGASQHADDDPDEP